VAVTPDIMPLRGKPHNPEDRAISKSIN